LGCGRSAFDALLKAAVRREFNMIAVWSSDRLGRSLKHLVEVRNASWCRPADLPERGEPKSPRRQFPPRARCRPLPRSWRHSDHAPQATLSIGSKSCLFRPVPSLQIPIPTRKAVVKSRSRNSRSRSTHGTTRSLRDQSARRRRVSGSPGHSAGTAMSLKQQAHGSELHGYPIPRRSITFDPRQEPGAGKPHAGICAGGEEQSSSLPRPDGLERTDVVADAAGTHCKIGRKAIVSSSFVSVGEQCTNFRCGVAHGFWWWSAGAVALLREILRSGWWG
jgi:hypothetical protein